MRMKEVPLHTPGAVLGYNEKGERCGYVLDIPTFDEWFVAKHGCTFEQALTIAMRQYVSEMVGAKPK